MHPALSIIFFTTLSGLGYGLAAVIGVGLVDGASAAGRIGYVLALGLIAGGLLCSTLHLGHPERAWRALTQWRTSWLSREGVLAVITFVPLGLAAIGSVFLAEVWVLPAFLAAVLCLVTVYSTSMIYASLKTVHQWHCGLTSAVFLTFAVSGGLLLAAVLEALTGGGSPTVPMLALIVFGVALVVKVMWWRRAGAEKGPSTIESATGLGPLGLVRLLDRPHTSENYLTREMGFRIARKHSEVLRRLVFLAGFAVPVLALVLALISAQTVAALALVTGVLSHVVGILIERWLFFAEARHAVMLYYGDKTA